jgi:hypothetical protein
MVYHRKHHNKLVLIFSKYSRKLECVSFKIGYRGLPLRKYSARDHFAVHKTSISEFVISLIYGVFFLLSYLYLFTARARRTTTAWATGLLASHTQLLWLDGLCGGYNSPGWLIALLANWPANICHQTT